MDILTKETLRDWLDPQPPEVSMTILFRALARIAVIWWDWAEYISDGEGKRSPLPLFRALITIQAAIRSPNSAFAQASQGSAQDLAAALEAIFRPEQVSRRVSDYKSALSVAQIFTDLMTFVEDYCNGHGPWQEGTSSEAVASLLQETIRKLAANERGFWVQVSRDRATISDGKDVMTAPLWGEIDPPWHQHWNAIQTRYQYAEKSDYWLNWFGDLWHGKGVNQSLAEKIALLPDEDWKRGAAHINARIAQISDGDALAATYNAERIEINPETGRLRLVSESDLPDDLAVYVRRKIARALRPFEGPGANQYAALSPVFADLRQTLDEAGTLPVELFDGCASATRRIAHHARLGDCPRPEEDAALTDFLARIREAGADVLANDPKTQEIVARRTSMRVTDVLVEDGAAVRQITSELAALSEGELAVLLPRGAEIATDPNADADVKAVESVKLMGRIIRIGKVTGGSILKSGDFGVRIYGYLQLLHAIIASPEFQRLAALIGSLFGS